jgi:hypothetical protein
MRRSLLPTALAAALGAGAATLAAPPEAEAISAGEVVGTWDLKLVIDGWETRDGETSDQRLRGDGTLVLRRNDADVNDGKLEVVITLDKKTDNSVLGDATPADAFKAVGTLQDSSLAAIAVGQSGFVNALNLRFDPDGKKLTGMWLAVFPAGTPESAAANGFAAGVGVKVVGRHVKSRESPRPQTARSR